MPALAVPEGAQLEPHLEGGAAPHPPLQALGCNGPSAVQAQTEAQPRESMHEGSSAGKAALALEGCEQPRNNTRAHSSSSLKPESSQAHATSQANGQHRPTEQESDEQSPKELHPAKAGMGEHVSGNAGLQDSDLQSLQEAMAASPAEELHCPSEAEPGPQESATRQPRRGDCAEAKDGTLDKHDNASSVQAAEEVRGSNDPGSGAPQSAVELQEGKAHASDQISKADGLPGDGLQDLQQAEQEAAATADPSPVSGSARSSLDRPGNIQAAQLSGPPQQPAHATSTPGVAEAAGTMGEPEEIHVIAEVSDEESSEDEHVTHHDLPCLVPECFSDTEDGDDADDEVFTFPAGMTELVLRGGLHPVKIPLPLDASFRYSMQQDDSVDDPPKQEKKPAADIPAATPIPEPVKVNHVEPQTKRPSDAASAPDGDGDGHSGHQEKADSMPKAKDSPKKAPVLARCALRPGVAGEDQCDKAADSFAIREGQRYLKVTCTEGCTITYHFTCWRRLERVYRIEHPDFSWKSKEGVRCFTDGCTGQVKLAQELEEEAGIDTLRRELLRLPDQAKKADRPQPPQEPPEQRHRRKKGPVQRAPEPEPQPVVQQERVADRAAAVPANTNVEDKQEPLPKPDRVPALGSFLIPRQDDDDEDLERLAVGLKGKKEKKKREKKKEKEVIQIPGPDQDSRQPSVFQELQREERPTPSLDTATFPKMVADDVPDLAGGENPLWDLLISTKSGTPAEHLLIWHIDTQSLARRGISCSDELYRLLSSHGRVASLEVYLHLSAAAISFTRTQDAQKALYEVEGHQLERKKLRGCFLREFPGDQNALTQKLQDSQAQNPPAAAASAVQESDQAAQIQALMNRESQNLPTDVRSVSDESMAALHTSLTGLSQEWPPARLSTMSRAGSQSSGVRSPARQNRVDMRSVQMGAEHLGLQPRAVPFQPEQAPMLPRTQANLSAAAAEFRPGASLLSAAGRGASYGTALTSAASQTSLSSADGLAASWPVQSSQLAVAGRAMSGRSDASSFQRADSAACDAPGKPLPLMLPGLDQLTAIQVVGCTRETLATFQQFQADGGFAIPTTDLGQYNALLDAKCTGLLLYENESQMLHGLWKSTQLADSGTEKLIEFEALADTVPLQGRLLLEVLQTHRTGELLVPQAARGPRLEALLPLLRPQGSPAPTPGSGAGNLAGLNPKSKPFSPFTGSGRSTPSTVTAAAVSTQQSAAATIKGAAARLTAPSPNQITQSTMPPQAQTWPASTERSNGPGSVTAGSSAAAGETTESQVQRQLGVTVHAEGFRASVTKFVEDSAKEPPGEVAGSKAEPQWSGKTLRPLQEGSIPQIVNRPSPEISIPPAINAGDPPSAHPTRQATPDTEARSTVNTPALPAPVSVQSSRGQTPVQASQAPQLREQQPVAPPATTGLRLLAGQVLQEHPELAGGGLTTGQQHQLGPPAAAAQQASSAPEAASPEQQQSQVQLPTMGVPGRRSSVQHNPAGALPDAAKQQAESSSPTVTAPAIPVRRVPLPKLSRVPKPAVPSSTSPQPGGAGSHQLASVLSFLLPKETPKAAATSSQSPPPKALEPSKPEPEAHKASKASSGEAPESAPAQPQLLSADISETSRPVKDLPAPVPKPSRPQPAPKGEKGSEQLSAGVSERASSTRANSGSPQVLSLQELVTANPKPTHKLTRAWRLTSASSQASRESTSPVRLSADAPAASAASSLDTPAEGMQPGKGKKKRKEYAPPSAPAAPQPPKPAPRPAPLGHWATGPPAALVKGDSSQAQLKLEPSPIPPLTPAAIATTPQVSQPQGPQAAGPPIAQRHADESQGLQPSQASILAAAAAEPARRANEESGAPRARPKPEYKPPAMSNPSESLPWVFCSPTAGTEGASQLGSTSITQPATRPRVPASEITPGAQAAAAGTSGAAVNPATSAAPAKLPSPERRAHICPLCRKGRAGHIVMACQHLGPCHKCVPSQDRLDLYPKCLQCHTKVLALLRFFP